MFNFSSLFRPIIVFGAVSLLMALLTIITEYALFDDNIFTKSNTIFVKSLAEEEAAFLERSLSIANKIERKFNLTFSYLDVLRRNVQQLVDNESEYSDLNESMGNLRSYKHDFEFIPSNKILVSKEKDNTQIVFFNRLLNKNKQPSTSLLSRIKSLNLADPLFSKLVKNPQAEIDAIAFVGPAGQSYVRVYPPVSRYYQTNRYPGNDETDFWKFYSPILIPTWKEYLIRNQNIPFIFFPPYQGAWVGKFALDFSFPILSKDRKKIEGGFLNGQFENTFNNLFSDIPRLEKDLILLASKDGNILYSSNPKEDPLNVRFVSKQTYPKIFNRRVKQQLIQNSSYPEVERLRLVLNRMKNKRIYNQLIRLDDKTHNLSIVKLKFNFPIEFVTRNGLSDDFFMIYLSRSKYAPVNLEETNYSNLFWFCVIYLSFLSIGALMLFFILKQEKSELRKINQELESFFIAPQETYLAAKKTLFFEHLKEDLKSLKQVIEAQKLLLKKLHEKLNIKLSGSFQILQPAAENILSSLVNLESENNDFSNARSSALNKLRQNTELVIELIKDFSFFQRERTGDIPLKLKAFSPANELLQNFDSAIKSREIQVTYTDSAEKILSDSEIYNRMLIRVFKFFNERQGDTKLNILKENNFVQIQISVSNEHLKSELKANLALFYLEKIEEFSSDFTANLDFYIAVRLLEMLQGNIFFEERLNEVNTLILSIPSKVDFQVQSNSNNIVKRIQLDSISEKLFGNLDLQSLPDYAQFFEPTHFPSVWLLSSSAEMESFFEKSLEKSGFLPKTMKNDFDLLAQLENEFPDMLVIVIDSLDSQFHHFLNLIRQKARFDLLPIYLIVNNDVPPNEKQFKEKLVNEVYLIPFFQKELLLRARITIQRYSILKSFKDLWDSMLDLESRHLDQQMDQLRSKVNSKTNSDQNDSVKMEPKTLLELEYINFFQELLNISRDQCLSFIDEHENLADILKIISLRKRIILISKKSDSNSLIYIKKDKKFGKVSKNISFPVLNYLLTDSDQFEQISEDTIFNKENLEFYKLKGTPSTYRIDDIQFTL